MDREEPNINQIDIGSNTKDGLSSVAFSLEEEEEKIVEKFLALKRALGWTLKDNAIKLEQKAMDEADGCFNISDNEEEVLKKTDEVSVETEDSIDMNFDLVNLVVEKKKSVKFNQQTFKDPASEKYCKKITKKLNQFATNLIDNSVRIDEPFLLFLYNFLVINHLEVAEIEIFFSFCADLIDVN